MNVTIRSEAVERLATEGLVLAIFEGTRRPSGAARAVDRAAGGAITACLDRGDFAGKKDQVMVVYPRGRVRAKRILLVGMGPEKELSLERIRQAGGRAVGKARELGVRELVTLVIGAGRGGLDPEPASQALVEGMLLANYSYDRYRTRNKEKNRPVREIAVVESDEEKQAAVKRGVQRARIYAEAVAFTRDLCNTPSLDMTPRLVAEQAEKLLGGKENGIKLSVLDEPEIRKLKMGSFLGVAKGSAEPPRFLVLEYTPAQKPAATICLVGKGITFDTGGISLKPAEGMDKMKYDMSGGGAVLGVFHALRKLRPAVRVVGLVPLTENMPGGRAIKPGDVLVAANGVTIEVTNTDAEGRLILADALAYAMRYKPDAVIDLATLTGAVVVALGGNASGVLGNNPGLIDRIRQAGERTGERVWELPMWSDYAELMRSDVADIKNSGGREAGTIQGAIFLSNFVDSAPWAHLDIAGTAWNDKDKPYGPKGSTGIGVRMLLDLVEHWSEKAPAQV